MTRIGFPLMAANLCSGHQVTHQEVCKINIEKCDHVTNDLSQLAADFNVLAFMVHDK